MGGAAREPSWAPPAAGAPAAAVGFAGQLGTVLLLRGVPTEAEAASLYQAGPRCADIEGALHAAHPTSGGTIMGVGLPPGTNPLNTDTDGDLIPDVHETLFEEWMNWTAVDGREVILQGLDKNNASDASTDRDRDGLNATE